MRVQGLTTDFLSILTEKQRRTAKSSESGGVAGSSESQERDAQGGGGYSRSDDGNSEGSKEGSSKESSRLPGLRVMKETLPIDPAEVRAAAESFSAASYAQALGLEAVVTAGVGAPSGLRVVLRDRLGKQIRSMSPDEFMDLRKDTQLREGLTPSVQRGRLLDRKA